MNLSRITRVSDVSVPRGTFAKGNIPRPIQAVAILEYFQRTLINTKGLTHILALLYPLSYLMSCERVGSVYLYLFSI